MLRTLVICTILLHYHICVTWSSPTSLSGCCLHSHPKNHCHHHSDLHHWQFHHRSSWTLLFCVEWNTICSKVFILQLKVLRGSLESSLAVIGLQVLQPDWFSSPSAPRPRDSSTDKYICVHGSWMRLLMKACQDGCSSSTNLVFINQNFTPNLWLKAPCQPISSSESSLAPPPLTFGEFGNELCMFGVKSIFLWMWCVFRLVFNVCGPGCIGSDKVVLNMFAQGPQKEKGPLTHEGLEPHWLHTHTNKYNIQTQQKTWQTHTHTHNPGLSLNLEEKMEPIHTHTVKRSMVCTSKGKERLRSCVQMIEGLCLRLCSSSWRPIPQTGSWQSDGGMPPRQ